ncbi:hypothetical protein [Paenibacillus aestuarii]|uniref:Uncharacterized protein n=1 Tax=Paenibacillus aestuarii TaxID=516965 RepID=A0ABW0K2Z9_9BACL|nr:hypothetical protein [Paenibacillus aestuarii]
MWVIRVKPLDKPDLYRQVGAPLLIGHTDRDESMIPEIVTKLQDRTAYESGKGVVLLLMVDGNAAVVVYDEIALVYDSETGAVKIQRIQSREDGSFTGVETLRTFQTPAQLALLRNVCLA